MSGELFIGGPMDGRRMAVKDFRPYVQFRELPKLWDWSRASTLDTLETIDHTYIRHKMTSGHFVYVHDEIRPEEIVRLLIRGYRRPDPL